MVFGDSILNPRKRDGHAGGALELSNGSAPRQHARLSGQYPLSTPPISLIKEVRLFAEIPRLIAGRQPEAAACAFGSGRRATLGRFRLGRHPVGLTDVPAGSMLLLN